MERDVVARVLTAAGAGLVVTGLFLVPWGLDGTGRKVGFLRLRGPLRDSFVDPGFDDRVQAAYLSWGFLVLVALCGLAVLLTVNRHPAAMAMTALGVALCGLWHQAGIGTVTNLDAWAYVPELGAALVVVGLLTGLGESMARRY